ncbi:MAG: oligosaccharide flippase family protein [Clostridiales bacterium]|nr:oligosaccharide flippase family protein [Clostridiales bacterium]
MTTLKNFFYNVGYQVLIIIVPLLLAPYVSRVVGPEGVGTYSYTYSIVTLFGLLANLGISKYGNREIAKWGSDRKKRSKIFSELLAFKISCSAVVLAVYLGFVSSFGGEYSLALYIQVFNLLSFMLDISWIFWGMQEFRITTAVSACVNVLSVFVIFGVVRTASDTNLYILILAVRAFLIQSGSWLFLHRYIDVKVSLKYLTARHWKGLVLLFFPVFAKYLYSMMDRIMIGNMVGITDVGYYENVQSITYTVVTVITAAGDVVMPKMTLLYRSEDKKGAETLGIGVFHLISFIAAGAMFGFIGVANDFIPLFYGEKFRVCAPLLQMIAPVIVFSGYSDWVRNVFLLPQYKDREYIIALTGGAVINFIINFILIRRIGNAGAVIGTVCAEFLVLAVQIWFVRGQIKIWYYLKTALIYCLLGSVILLPCRIIENLEIHPFWTVTLEILISGIIYTAGVGIFIYLREKKLYQMLRCFIGGR